MYERTTIPFVIIINIYVEKLVFEVVHNNIRFLGIHFLVFGNITLGECNYCDFFNPLFIEK